MASLSSVIQALPLSGIRKIFDRAVALENQGQRVIRFDIGQPDLPTPAFVVAAAQRALDQGFTRYVANRGIPELRQAIADKIQRDSGIRYDPDTEIVVTTGASEAVAATLLAVLDETADVLIPEPAWPHYVCCARLARAGVVRLPLSAAAGFALTRQALEQTVTPRTRLLLLNNPVNPTGKLYSRPDQEEVLAFARDRELFVLADEMYEHFVYRQPFCSFASLPGARQRTLLVNGFSKSFGMTGWRLGYVAGPAEVIVQVNKAHQFLTVCATSFAQPGAAAAYTHPEAKLFLERARQEYQQRNQVMIEEASRIPGLRFHSPEGAFYLFPRLPDWMPDAEETAALLLEETRVAVVPGNVFGPDFGRFVRLSYGTNPPEEIRAGMRRIASLTLSRRKAA